MLIRSSTLLLSLTWPFQVSGLVPDSTILKAHLDCSREYFISVAKDLEVSDAIILVDIADREFGLNLNMNLARGEITMLSTVPEILTRALFTDFKVDGPIPPELHEWLRSDYPSSDAMMMHALLCGQTTLPDGYFRTVIKNAESGGYELTHSALQLHMLKKYGCPTPPDISLKKLAKEISAIQTSEVSYDLKWEAIALLCLMGERRLVDTAVLEQLLLTQGID